MTWVIAAAVILVGTLVAAWLTRSSDTAGWHDSARSEVLRTLLAARGLDAHVATRAPVEMPDLQLPLAWEWRARAGAHSSKGGVRWLLYDSETSGRGPAGCNSVTNSSGERKGTRHTVVLLEVDSLALPRFTVVPNVRKLLRDQLPERFREAGMADSTLAHYAGKFSDKVAALEEHGTAIAFLGQTEFEAAFRVTGDNEDAVRALLDQSTIRLLMEHRWAIVEAQGRWLAVSRNTARAFSEPERTEGQREGFLSPESTSELLGFSGRLAARFGVSV
jgi:hypothetical protein